jgi:hypothetical protein
MPAIRISRRACLLPELGLLVSRIADEKPRVSRLEDDSEVAMGTRREFHGRAAPGNSPELQYPSDFMATSGELIPAKSREKPFGPRPENTVFAVLNRQTFAKNIPCLAHA